MLTSSLSSFCPVEDLNFFFSKNLQPSQNLGIFLQDRLKKLKRTAFILKKTLSEFAPQLSLDKLPKELLSCHYESIKSDYNSQLILFSVYLLKQVNLLIKNSEIILADTQLRLNPSHSYYKRQLTQILFPYSKSLMNPDLTTNPLLVEKFIAQRRMDFKRISLIIMFMKKNIFPFLESQEQWKISIDTLPSLNILYVSCMEYFSFDLCYLSSFSILPTFSETHPLNEMDKSTLDRVKSLRAYFFTIIEDYHREICPDDISLLTDLQKGQKVICPHFNRETFIKNLDLRTHSIVFNTPPAYDSLLPTVTRKKETSLQQPLILTRLTFSHPEDIREELFRHRHLLNLPNNLFAPQLMKLSLQLKELLKYKYDSIDIRVDGTYQAHRRVKIDKGYSEYKWEDQSKIITNFDQECLAIPRFDREYHRRPRTPPLKRHQEQLRIAEEEKAIKQELRKKKIKESELKERYKLSTDQERNIEKEINSYFKKTIKKNKKYQEERIKTLTRLFYEVKENYGPCFFKEGRILMVTDETDMEDYIKKVVNPSCLRYYLRADKTIEDKYRQFFSWKYPLKKGTDIELLVQGKVDDFNILVGQCGAIALAQDKKIYARDGYCEVSESTLLPPRPLIPRARLSFSRPSCLVGNKVVAQISLNSKEKEEMIQEASDQIHQMAFFWIHLEEDTWKINIIPNNRQLQSEKDIADQPICCNEVIFNETKIGGVINIYFDATLMKEWKELFQENIFQFFLLVELIQAQMQINENTVISGDTSLRWQLELASWIKGLFLSSQHLFLEDGSPSSAKEIYGKIRSCLTKKDLQSFNQVPENHEEKLLYLLSLIEYLDLSYDQFEQVDWKQKQSLNETFSAIQNIINDDQKTHEILEMIQMVHTQA